MKKIFNPIKLINFNNNFFIKTLLLIVGTFTVTTIIYYLFIFNINSQPSGYFSSINLVLRIVTQADCNNLDPYNRYETYAEFQCSTGNTFLSVLNDYSLEKMKEYNNYTIYIFYDEKIKNKHLAEYTSNKYHKYRLKIGNYFIIQYDGQFSEDGQFRGIDDETALKNFPGTLYQY